MQALPTVVAVLALLGLASAQTAGQTLPDSPLCPLSLDKWTVRREAKGQKLEALTNSVPNFPFNGMGIFPSVSLARTTLAPCGVRTMHTHSNVDEMIYVVSGSKVSASVAWPNGTICEAPFVAPGTAFLYPRNLVHSARNLDCYEDAVILGFFTAFDTATINIAASANNMPGGPFLPYTQPDRRIDVAAASDFTTLAYDPVCLADCNLPKTFGQNPVS